MNQKTLLLVAGGGVAAFALYKYMQSRNTTTVITQTSTGVSVPSVNPTGYVVAAQVPQGLSNWLTGTPAAYQQKIGTWLLSAPQDQVDTLWNIVQDFNSGTTLPASWSAWWNQFTSQLGLT